MRLGYYIRRKPDRKVKSKRPLDNVNNLVSAYSTEKELTSYTGYCMRVRRASDDVLFYIAFNPSTYKMDNNSHCYNSELADQGTVSSVFSGTDGFVTVWYDQVGSNQATQETALSQFKIITNGVVNSDGLYSDSASKLVISSSNYLVNANNCRIAGTHKYIATDGKLLYREIGGTTMCKLEAEANGTCLCYLRNSSGSVRLNKTSDGVLFNNTTHTFEFDFKESNSGIKIDNNPDSANIDYTNLGSWTFVSGQIGGLQGYISRLYFQTL
jgi:hypothetical protein